MTSDVPAGSTPGEEGGLIHVDAATVNRLVTAIFERAGCGPREARTVAERLSGANLRGHDSHGIIRVPRYVEMLEDEWIYPNRRIEIETENDVLAVIDGRFGLGQSVGEQTVDVGVAKATQRGVAVTALKNSGHLGRIGDWAERAAASKVASIHMVNVRGSLLVAPFGGVDRRGSTSPFCCAVPVPGEDPIVLDFATSLVAEGKALVALRGGAPLPHGAVITPEGALTDDPGPLYGAFGAGQHPNPNEGPGALCGFGLHKGSGLNFFMEMFGGVLTGSGTAAAMGETERRRFCNGMLSIYLSVEYFNSQAWFAREIRSYVEFFKSARPTQPGGEVLIPGEKERRTMDERLRTGLPISTTAWEEVVATAYRVGLDEAGVEALLGSESRSASVGA